MSLSNQHYNWLWDLHVYAAQMTRADFSRKDRDRARMALRGALRRKFE